MLLSYLDCILAEPEEGCQRQQKRSCNHFVTKNVPKFFVEANNRKSAWLPWFFFVDSNSPCKDLFLLLLQFSLTFFQIVSFPSLKRTLPNYLLTLKNFVPDYFLTLGNPGRILFIMVSHGGSHVINMGFWLSMRLRWLDIGQYLWTSTLSHSINTQKRTTSSHLDVMLGQQPFIWSAFICRRLLISLYFLVHVSVSTFVVHILKK